MTPNLLDELEGVVRLIYSDCRPDEYRCAATNFLRTHHATLADMAKRLEAAERECEEQARLNGMGAERELALRAKLDAAERDASRYQRLRDADPDSGSPYIARERQDSWGNWKTEWLGSLDADRAIDATQEGEG